MVNTLETTTRNEIWKKADNLEKLLKFEDKKIYEVPYFMTVKIWQTTDKIKNKFLEKWIKNVSVRSSSHTEDTEDDSKAWAFKTYTDVDINDIDAYINEIQKHSLEKFWYKIPIIIQEMVWWVSWVAFSTDPDTWKNYTILSYHNWAWEDLVSWSKSWQVVKIFNWCNISLIWDELHKKMFNSIIYLKKKLDYENLDIEFVYSWDTLYLLQVRPITKINWWQKETSILIDRYANFVTWLLKRKEIILWDMIDINPEELVWKQPLLIKTFFWYIFPETSLTDARENLWYKKTDNFFSLVLDKTYIDLEKNVISFLPNTLTQDEVNIFLKYYKDLINKFPDLQNQLDSLLYPNNLEKVKEILNWLELSNDTKNVIIKKFESFFIDLKIKINYFSSNYDNIEKDLLSKSWVNSYYELLTLKNYNWNINDLLLLIKECTYYFTIFARSFFYLSNNWNIENQDYFKNNIYQSHIAKWLINNWEAGVNFDLTEWFNFFSLINQTFNLEDLNIWQETNESIDDIDISKVARENLKFIFMNLFRLLWIKILFLLEKNGINSKDIEYIDFKSLIWYINWEITIEYLNILINKWKRKKEVSNSLDLPSVINKWITIIENKLFWNNGFYSWEWQLEWDLCYINDITDFQTKDYIWKIIIIENATPEIDIYLNKMKWIITKNWWPLAHIMIRSREFWIPAVVGTNRYLDIINLNPKKLLINFDDKTISL